MGHSSPIQSNKYRGFFFCPFSYIDCLLFFLFSLFEAYDQNSDIAIQETPFILILYVYYSPQWANCV